MDRDERQRRKGNLARGLLQDARDGLMLSLRFLDRVLYRLEWEESSQPFLGTDARRFYYHTDTLLAQFQEERNKPARVLLHSILHCILFHPFQGAGKDRRLWNLACDMAVEGVLRQLQLGLCRTSNDPLQDEVIKGWKNKEQRWTGEHLYLEFEKTPPTEKDLLLWEALFYQDHHGWWEEEPNQEFSEDWKQLSRQVAMDLETYSRSVASRSEGLVQNLRQVHRDRVNYEAFLRKFSVLREEMRVNDDEFDYVFYSYGMRLYGNMPLIEPLEYVEEVRIKDFVIALDTSGSCSGELIQTFLTKTFSILKSTGSFFRQVNLYIIMSDNKIQQVTHITDSETFDAFIKDLAIVGLGGTDFRPVFSYVDELRAQGKLEHLKGLIYFTDGHGRFPARKPEYDTAFVFVEGDTEPQVPSWAIKITLGEQELKS